MHKREVASFLGLGSVLQKRSQPIVKFHLCGLTIGTKTLFVVFPGYLFPAPVSLILFQAPEVLCQTGPSLIFHRAAFWFDGVLWWTRVVDAGRRKSAAFTPRHRFRRLYLRTYT